MIPGRGQVFPVFPAACQDAPAPDWAATHPLETPPLGSPEPWSSRKTRVKLGGNRSNGTCSSCVSGNDYIIIKFSSWKNKVQSYSAVSLFNFCTWVIHSIHCYLFKILRVWSTYSLFLWYKQGTKMYFIAILPNLKWTKAKPKSYGSCSLDSLTPDILPDLRSWQQRGVKSYLKLGQMILWLQTNYTTKKLFRNTPGTS